VANMWFVIPAATILQTRTTDSVRGRVLAASSSLNRVAMVAGVVAFGALSDSAPLALVAAGVGAAAVAVAVAGTLRVSLREA
jgi:hypothetical protein